MTKWFECKVRYEKTAEDGKEKKVTELYLVDACNFTEAENRMIEQMRPFISGEFDIPAIKRTNLSEVFFSEDGGADRWFKCKVLLITFGKNGKEKKSGCYMLVQAAGFQDAINNLEKRMKDTMSDYEIASISATDLMDVFPYSGHGTDKNTQDYQGKAETTEAIRETPETRTAAVPRNTARIGFAAIKERDDKEKARQAAKEGMAGLDAFIKRANEAKEHRAATRTTTSDDSQERAYKEAVKAVINCPNSYGTPIWRIAEAVGESHKKMVHDYVRRMESEGLAERFGQSVHKKVSVLPERFQ